MGPLMQNERTAAVFEGGAKSNRNSCLDTPSYLTETNGQRFAESMQILVSCVFNRRRLSPCRLRAPDRTLSAAAQHRNAQKAAKASWKVPNLTKVRGMLNR